MKTALRLLAAIGLYSIFGLKVAFAQYEYTYPSNASKYESPETPLILRNGEAMNAASVTNDKIVLVGSQSGKVKANVVLSTDGKTVCIKPSVSFAYNETVTMSAHGLETQSGKI